MTRTDPPHHGSERDILESFLEYQRSTVFMKVRGLSDADAAKRLYLSGTAKKIPTVSSASPLPTRSTASLPHTRRRTTRLA